MRVFLASAVVALNLNTTANAATPTQEAIISAHLQAAAGMTGRAQQLEIDKAIRLTLVAYGRFLYRQ